MNLTLFTVSLCLLYGCSSPDAVFPEDGSHEKAYKRLSSNHLIQDVSGLPFYWDVNNVSCPSKSVDGDIITFTGGCLSKGSTITGAVTLDRSKGEDNWTIMYKDFVVGSTHWNGSVGVHTKKDKSKYVDLDFTTLSVDGNEVLTTPSLLSINATLECKTEQNCVYQEGGTGSIDGIGSFSIQGELKKKVELKGENTVVIKYDNGCSQIDIGSYQSERRCK